MQNKELAQLIRQDVIGEYEAILQYEAHIMATCDEKVKKMLAHIANEERGHIAELKEILNDLVGGF